MTRRILCALAGAAVLASAAPAVGHAQPAPPDPGVPCDAAVDGALTLLPDYTPVRCGDGRWSVLDTPYPTGDRWLSTDAGLTLHGQGRRNPEMMSGPWTAYPQGPDTRCHADQVAVVRAGEVGPPQVAEGAPGQPLHFAVVPVMFSIDLSGHCLWQAG
ncbi:MULTISPECIES: hypothetical protein [Mycobacteriaceae]|uniref:hypothetical protein n=1 Tax=Mycobacteriaceae TaxID=1762 RepID=UPI0007FBA00D|nr:MULTISPECIES: hypothetical protein [Mycobacteriaceae]MCK0177307.1 hypothetical protein [Mycolicibacterium sp. F2034L]OBB57527.1 hypothetical protein A5757_20420 [Mycobacterium sp. 852013-51886_SCH5428379]